MKFSIILPAYNAANTIHQCVESVLKQTYSNWELIAVDDGSSDSTYEILNKYSEQDSRIVAIHQNNAGPGLARNHGIAASTGDYIAFIDSDDYWEHDFLELVFSKIKENNADVVFYDLIHETESGKFIRNTLLSAYASCSKEEILRMQMTGKFEWGMVKVIKKSLIVQNNLKFSEDAVGEEAIFSFDVLNHGDVVSFVEKPLYHYVSSSNGQHKKGDLDPWHQIVDHMLVHLTELGIEESYIPTINSFAAKAMSISLYRISIDDTILNKKQVVRNKIDDYSKKYDFKNLDTDSLDKKSKIILSLAIHRWIRPIVWISMFKYKFM